MGHMVLQALDQAALANAWMTHEDNHVALPGFHVLPTLDEQSTSCARPTSGVSPRAPRNVQATVDTAFSEHAIDGDEAQSHTSEGLCP